MLWKGKLSICFLLVWFWAFATLLLTQAVSSELVFAKEGSLTGCIGTLFFESAKCWMTRLYFTDTMFCEHLILLQATGIVAGIETAWSRNSTYNIGGYYEEQSVVMGAGVRKGWNAKSCIFDYSLYWLEHACAVLAYDSTCSACTHVVSVILVCVHSDALNSAIIHSSPQ